LPTQRSASTSQCLPHEDPRLSAIPWEEEEERERRGEERGEREKREKHDEKPPK